MDKGKMDKTKTAAVAAVAAAGVLVGGAFSSPSDLMDDDGGIFSPAAIAQYYGDGDSCASDGDGSEDKEKLKRSTSSSVRRLVSSAPPIVKACVGVPLWGIGWVIISVLSALWASVLSPAAAAVLGWLGIALLAVLVFALAVKTVFPDLPLKKILNRHSISAITVLVLAFAAFDTVLPYFWDAYENISRLIKLLASLTAAAVPVAFFLRREARRRRALSSSAVPEEDAEKETRRLVKELADSVS